MVVALKEVKIRGEIRTLVDYAIDMIQVAAPSPTLASCPPAYKVLQFTIQHHAEPFAQLRSFCMLVAAR